MSYQFHHLASEEWTVEGVEPSSAGCKPVQASRLPVRRHAHGSSSGPGGDRTHILLFKKQVLSLLSYKASQCVGQESNLHSEGGCCTDSWARQCPADTFVSESVRKAPLSPEYRGEGLRGQSLSTLDGI